MTPFERLVTIMIKPWVAISYLGLIALSFLSFDKPIAYYFHSVDPETNLLFLTWVTKLGEGVVYMVSLPLVALFFGYVYRNRVWEERAWFLWLCVLFPNIVCVLLKVMLGRARPGLWFSDQQYGFYGWHLQADFWSFPSGHTTTIMGVVAGLCVVFPRYCYAFIILGLCVVSSRIMLTYHYLSDVLAAGYLALLEVGLLAWWVRRKSLLKQGLMV